ncbi:MAG: DUF169 domain-containing protein [Acidobacteria bacterium]|nr:DUF169 domain-containing protein [Acidobacteriota bacterium]
MSFQQLLFLSLPPVAIAFRSTAPPGVPHVEAVGPAGCSYWKLAAEGKVFYTEAADYYNCPIGAYTHGVDLPAGTAAELQGLVETMVGLEYLRREEVPNIPRRTAPFGVALYGPFPAAPFDPDVVLVRGQAKQVMLIAEAAHMAGIGSEVAARVRPTCAVLPETMQKAQASISLGCIGNRVYTELGDDELYIALPGQKAFDVLSKLSTIIRANRELEQFHRGRYAAS